MHVPRAAVVRELTPVNRAGRGIALLPAVWLLAGAAFVPGQPLTVTCHGWCTPVPRQRL